MAEKELLEQEQKELETLTHNSPKALPDNPTQAGWTSSQIKNKLSNGLFYLYTLFKGERRKVSSKFDEVNSDITNKNNTIQTKLQEVEETIATNKELAEINLNNVETTLDEKITINTSNITRLETNKADKTYVDNAVKDKADKEYVEQKIDNLFGEGNVNQTLDTIAEISNALKGNPDIIDVLNASISTKADKTELFSKDYNDLYNKPTIPTKISQLEQDIDVGGINEEQVLDIIEENSAEVETLNIGTSDSYDETSDNEVPTTKAVNQIITNKGYITETDSKNYTDTKIADLVNSAPKTLDTLGELAQAIQENGGVVEALNSAIGNKADKTEIPTKLSDLEQDIELGGSGVSEEDVMEIVESNSIQVNKLSIGTSTNYDETSDSEIPTTKAVKTMIGNGGSGGSTSEGKLIESGIKEWYDDTAENKTLFIDKMFEANKFYYIKLGMDNYSMISGIVRAYSHNTEMAMTPFYWIGKSENPVPVMMLLSINYIMIMSVSELMGTLEDLGTKSVYYEIWELPFTLGGTE